MSGVTMRASCALHAPVRVSLRPSTGATRALCPARAHRALPIALPRGIVVRGARRLVVRAEEKPQYSKLTKMRSEAQAPFRAARVFLFGGMIAASGLGTYFAVVRLIASAVNASGSVPLPVAFKDLGIDLGVLAFCLFFLNRDNQSRERQMARISREERLGKLRVQLTTGKMVNLEQLRNFARPVLVVGSKEAVEQNMAAAEPFREKLLERGVLTVPVVLDGGVPELPELEEGDTKWRAKPVLIDKWKAWMTEQMSSANLEDGQAVYLSLRMDGRVRGSGKGCPPWEVLSMQLPVTSGMWAGFGDGFDGFVGEQ